MWPRQCGQVALALVPLVARKQPLHHSRTCQAREWCLNVAQSNGRFASITHLVHHSPVGDPNSGKGYDDGARVDGKANELGLFRPE